MRTKTTFPEIEIAIPQTNLKPLNETLATFSAEDTKETYIS